MTVRRDCRRFLDLHARDWVQESSRQDRRAFVVAVFVVLVVFVLVVFALAAVGVFSLLFARVSTGSANFTGFDAASESLITFRVVGAFVFLLFLWFFLRFFQFWCFDFRRRTHFRFLRFRRRLDFCRFSTNRSSVESFVFEVEAQLTLIVQHVVFVLDDAVFHQRAVIVGALVADPPRDGDGERAPLVVGFAVRKLRQRVHELLVLFWRPSAVRLAFARGVETVVVRVRFLNAILPSFDSGFGPSGKELGLVDFERRFDVVVRVIVRVGISINCC